MVFSLVQLAAEFPEIAPDLDTLLQTYHIKIPTRSPFARDLTSSSRNTTARSGTSNSRGGAGGMGGGTLNSPLPPSSADSKFSSNLRAKTSIKLPSSSTSSVSMIGGSVYSNTLSNPPKSATTSSTDRSSMFRTSTGSALGGSHVGGNEGVRGGSARMSGGGEMVTGGGTNVLKSKSFVPEFN